jgi:hypothetical protein
MCRQHQRSSALADRLGKFNFIDDRFHASGHVGGFCREHCMPDLPKNKSILSTFPALRSGWALEHPRMQEGYFLGLEKHT